MSASRAYCLALALLVLAIPSFPQGNPTGTISGHVTDPGGLSMPGVRITASSPVLQGVRAAVTSPNGDYIVPFLPAGEYKLRFDSDGFAPLELSISLKMADTQPLNVQMTLSTVA